MSTRALRVWLSGLWLAVALCASACSDPVDEQEPDVPCGGACPAEQCNFGMCTGVDDEPDADDEPDMVDEPDADEPDVDDEPDGDDEPDVEDEPDGDDDPGCDDDGACDQGEICDDSVEPAVCREGCRDNEDCAAGQRCDEETLTCVEGCAQDTDCGPPETFLACDVETGQCEGVSCRADNQCESNQFCNVGQGYECAQGCRVGECPNGEFCDLDSRECIFGCGADEDCDSGFYCDGQTRTCLEGCRGDEECLEGERCGEVDVEGQTLQRCVPQPCDGDEQCPEAFFCGEDPQGEEGTVCLPGCRVEPNTCPEGQVCNPDSRLCLQGCEDDEACGPGQICQTEQGVSACVAGCREDGGCAEGQRCLTEEARCTCVDNGDCVAGQEVCADGACTAVCFSNAECDQEAGFVCQPELQICVQGCANDDDCDQEAGFVCDPGLLTCVPRTCQSDDECPDDRFCDFNAFPSICTQGCRAGGCPQGQFCNTQTRQCDDGCQADIDCAEGLYCDQADGCVEGCRDGLECGEGQGCEVVEIDGDRRQRCVSPSCTQDDDCQDAEYCGEGEFGRDICLAGCRFEPDNCPGELRCNPILRTCIAPACEGDGDCLDGQICDEAQEPAACRPGCRDDDGCQPGNSCDTDTLLCVCQSDEGCAEGQVCDGGLCVAPCFSNADCEDGLACDINSQRCVEACEGDGDCPEGLVCNEGRGLCQGQGCIQDDNCAPDQFCDLGQVEPICVAGCRDGGCPGDQVCDPGTRQCRLGCVQDGDCGPGTYCGENGQCLEGCRNDDECDSPQTCELVLNEQEELRQACVPPACEEDGDCDDDAFCAVNEVRQRRECQIGCRTEPDNCPESFVCNALTRQCDNEICNDDLECGQGRICQDNGQEVACVAGCRDDAGCPGESTCDLNTNTCSCVQSEDCSEGQVCDEGICQDPCGSDDDCEGELVCNLQTGLCLQGCTFDGECGGREQGFFCEQLTRTCQRLTCANNTECPDRFYCDVEQEPARCFEGCRVGQCPQGQICDLDERQCVPGCAQDDDCPVETFCDPDQLVCVEGCRDDGSCSVPGLSLVCDLETRDCIGAPCVDDARCGAEQFCDVDAGQCSFGCREDSCPEGLFCDLDTRQCNEGCGADEDCPEGLFCTSANECQFGCREGDCLEGDICTTVDRGLGEERLCLPPTCASDDECDDAQFCGVDPELGLNFCQDGCRTEPDNCPQEGAVCDPETRQCVVGAGCVGDGDCPAGQICQEDNGQRSCTVGCREDNQCGAEQFCDQINFVCSCEVSDDCPADGQVCDFGFCFEACTTDADCPDEARCDVDAGLCFFGECRDDAFEPNEDRFLAPPLEPGQTLALRMCYNAPPPEQSIDCFNVTLNPGPFEATATFSHSDGDLNLFLYDAGGFVTASATSEDDNELLQVEIEFGGFYTLCAEPNGEPFESSYELLVAPPL